MGPVIHMTGAGAIPRALPPVAATLAGSLPKPAWLAVPGVLWPSWRLPAETLAEGIRDAVRLAVQDQEAAGLDLVSDGEQPRRHFVHAFLEGLEGVDAARRTTIGIRGDRYRAEVPTVVGPVRRTRPVHADEVRWVRAHTTRGIKFTLPGPFTSADTVADAHYGDRAGLALDVAAALNAEARELAALGADLIQLDEPAFNVDAYAGEIQAWGMAALDRALAGLPCRTGIHICYGYGIPANVEWKAALGREWRQYERTFPLLARSRVDQVSLECAGSRVPLELVGLLDGKAVEVGVIDVASDRVETAEEVAATLRRALGFVPPDRLLASTNCGMAPLSREVACGKLAALGQGAALVRAELRRA